MIRPRGRGVSGPVTDPVCEMSLDAADARRTRRYEGVTYYFCSRRCASVFARDPDLYAAPESGTFYPTPGRVGSARFGPQ